MQDRWARIEDLFDRVLALPEAERSAFLARECGDDAALRAEVESLVRHAGDDQVRSSLAAAAEALVGGAAEQRLRVGPYRLLDVLGEGGMGTVYLAERDDGQFRHTVALKVLQHAVASQLVVARFRDERQILATLDHPAIVKLLDGGATTDGLPYLVMEHIDGVPLEAYAAKLGIRERVALMLKVCEPLQYAHQKLVVHRDIKPSNVLVTPTGQVKLLDFGIAKLLEPGAAGTREARTRTGLALLTPEYASPEQARGGVVTVASDVYALGAVLFHLLVGHAPQRASEDVLETLRAICDVELPRPSIVAPPAVKRAIAGDLDNIVMRALQKDPANRYPSVAAFADDLERYLDARPVRAREATFGYRAQKFVRRHLGALALATVIVAALTTATVVATMNAADARQRTRTLLVEQGRQALAAGFAARATPLLAEALGDGEDTPAVRFLLAEALRPKERVVATVHDFPRGLLDVEWFPDASKFVACGNAARVGIYRRDGSLVHMLPVDGDGDVGRCIVSHRGDMVIGLTSSGMLMRWNASSGQREWSRQFGDWPADQHAVSVSTAWPLTLSRDDRYLLSCAVSHGTHLIDSTSDATVFALPGTESGNPCALSDDGRQVFAARAGHVTIHDSASGEVRRDLPMIADGKPAFIAALALNRAADRLYVLHEGGLLVQDLESGEAPVSVIVADMGPSGLSLSDDETRFVVYGRHLVRVYDARTPALVSAFAGLDRTEVYHASFGPDGARVVVTSDDDRARIFDATSGELLIEQPLVVTPGSAPHAIALPVKSDFAPDGSLVLTHAGSEPFVWRPDHAPVMHVVEGGSTLQALALSPAHDRVAFAGGGSEIRRVDDDALIARLPLMLSTGVDWSVTDRVAFTTRDGYATIYSADGVEQRRIAGHVGIVNAIAFSPDGQRVATAGDDGQLRVVDADDGTLRWSTTYPSRAIAVAWSRDGTRLACAEYAGVLHVLDADGQAMHAISEPDLRFLSVTFTRDGTGLVAGSRERVGAIWDIASGARRVSLRGHTAQVCDVEPSPSGAFIATASVDRTVRIWDAAGTELALYRLGGENLQVEWLDDRRVMGVGYDARARVWRIEQSAISEDEARALSARPAND